MASPAQAFGRHPPARPSEQAQSPALPVDESLVPTIVEAGIVFQWVIPEDVDQTAGGICADKTQITVSLPLLGVSFFVM